MADPLTILGGIQTCETFIKEIYGIISDIAGCPDDVKALQIHFKIDNLLLPRFLSFFKDNKEDLAPDVNVEIADVTISLSAKLAILKFELSKLKDGRGWRRMTWPWVKMGMSDATDELSNWTARINTVISRLPPKLQARLSQKFASDAFNADDHPLSAILARVKMTDRRKEEDHWTLTDFSHLKKSQTQPPGPGPFFDNEVLHIPYIHVVNKETEEQKRIELDVAKVVSILQDSIAKEMHFPKSASYFTKTNTKGDTETLNIVYAAPTGVKKIEPLNAVLGGRKHSLTDRFRIAKEITAAVSYIHAIGWVHKGIRTPKIMLCYYDGDEDSSLGSVSVLGFNFSRRTIKEAVSDHPRSTPEDEVYKHPDRQIENLSLIKTVNDLVAKRDITKAGSIARFNTKHDVYSLGVVLLEVGLWEKLENAIPGIGGLKPDQKKTQLVEKTSSLKGTMGNKYAWIVEQCLEVQDPEDVTAQQVLEYLENLVL